MASIDKAAVVFSIAIAAIGVGIALYGGSTQDTSSYTSSVDSADYLEQDAQIDYFGELEGEMKEEESMMVDGMIMEESSVEFSEDVVMKKTEKSTGPQTHDVEIPLGTSVQGCQETNECYIPADITINAGDTVTWTNADTAVHTVSAGIATDAKLEVFHSDLMLPAADPWSQTFEDSGSYDYFCIVHPWMIGSVTVN